MLRPEDAPSHRTLAFLFTDIEDSTGLWQRAEGSMRAAMVVHDDLLRRAVEARGGEVFKTVGDAFCVAFESVEAALGGAVDAQIALRDGPLKVRMAVHVCDVEPLEGDYRGVGLSRAARLLGLAVGEQILVSDGAASLARDRLAPPLSLSDLGECRLRSFERAERVWQLRHPELQGDFPPLAAGLTTPHNLPAQLTEFVGRERESAEVRRRLAASALVTLTGSGGSGKTRLALEIADALLAEYPDGVWFVDLSPRTAGEPLFGAVAGALGLRPDPGSETSRQLIDYLAAKRVLIVLDNCEHLVTEAARLAETLLTACRSLRILATSREALGVFGEVAWPVPTLSLPEANRRLGPKRLLTYESARLFADRATAVQPSFRITGESAPYVAEICRRLDGIPLALIIAASWASVLTPRQIAERIQDRFKLLKQGASRTAPPRQQTLRAVVDWSYRLCSGPERALLRRLAVFAGGWDIAAAEAVCEDGALVDDALGGLFSLAHKSLVLVEPATDGERRFRLLETIRQFARELLDSSGESGDLEKRHRAHYLALAEEAAPHLITSEAKPWLTRLETEHDNLRLALTGASAEEEARFVASLFWFWHVRGHAGEGRAWAERALANAEGADNAALVKVRNAAAVLAMNVGDLAAAEAHLVVLRDELRSQDNTERLIPCVNNLGTLYARQGKTDGALECFSEVASLMKSHDAPVMSQVSALANLGGIHAERDDLKAAVRCYGEALEVWGEQEDSLALMNVLGNLAEVYHRQGRWEEGEVLLRRNWKIAEASESPEAMAIVLTEISFRNFFQNNEESLKSAVKLLGVAENCRKRCGIKATRRVELEPWHYQLRVSVSPEQWESLWNESLELTVDEAVETGFQIPSEGI